MQAEMGRRRHAAERAGAVGAAIAATQDHLELGRRFVVQQVSRSATRQLRHQSAARV